MARQVLDNGVVLPSEFSDDWYDDMTSNLTKLDEVIGSDAEKLDESDVGEAAISNDYDDLDNKPAYNVLRRAGVTLTAGGTGNYSDLDTTSKIKAGDYVLDAVNKLYSITAINTANSTYTVSAAAIINITDKSELGAAALSNSYDDLNNLPAYNVLRRAAVTLTAGGTGNYSDLDSVSKIKAGDYVLDAANKLYSITAIDTANSTYTVSAAAIINITDKSELGAAALSNSYDDLNNLPSYGITRLVNTAITDNSNVSFSNISSVSKIAAGDFLLDTAGKMYVIASVDTVNETAAVTTPLTVLALDSNVMHLSGNETSSGIKDFSDTLRIYNSNSSATTAQLFLINSKVNRGQNVYGDQVIMFRDATNKLVTAIVSRVTTAGASALLLHAYNVDQNNQQVTNSLSFIKYLDGSCNLLPDVNDVIELGSSAAKFKNININKINNINPGALSFPDLSSGLDISAYITDLTGASNINKYTPTVNGWISIGLSNADFIELYIPSSLMGGTFTKSINNYAQAFMPVIANKEVRIALKGSSIGWAKFFPNLGNV